MTAQRAIAALQAKGFNLREIAALLNARGIKVSYSTISRITKRADYPVKWDVALALIELTKKGAK